MLSGDNARVKLARITALTWCLQVCRAISSSASKRFTRQTYRRIDKTQRDSCKLCVAGPAQLLPRTMLSWRTPLQQFAGSRTSTPGGGSPLLVARPTTATTDKKQAIMTICTCTKSCCNIAHSMLPSAARSVSAKPRNQNRGEEREREQGSHSEMGPGRGFLDPSLERPLAAGLRLCKLHALARTKFCGR